MHLYIILSLFSLFFSTFFPEQNNKRLENFGPEVPIPPLFENYLGTYLDPNNSAQLILKFPANSSKNVTDAIAPI
jgi:hypothetical protein